jgi:hypothetical protein
LSFVNQGHVAIASHDERRRPIICSMPHAPDQTIQQSRLLYGFTNLAAPASILRNARLFSLSFAGAALKDNPAHHQSSCCRAEGRYHPTTRPHRYGPGSERCCRTTAGGGAPIGASGCSTGDTLLFEDADLISSYSRAQALADGQLIDVSPAACSLVRARCWRTCFNRHRRDGPVAFQNKTRPVVRIGPAALLCHGPLSPTQSARR